VSSLRLLVPALRFPAAADDLGPALALAARGVGGFCVFGGDARLPEHLARLQAAAPWPLLFAADLEDGAGQQVAGAPVHPPAAALDPDAAEAAGARTAEAARPLGITMTFAPVCDVASEPQNPILHTRAFPDPAACAPRFVRGARRHGLRTCAKHFPGHGATTADSHDALPLVTADAATWHRRDFPPFAACIAEGVDAVMTAHLACPALTGSDTLPATLSARVMRDLLRGELGFEGLVVTDALLMEGVRSGRSEADVARAALDAGCDVVLCPADVEAVAAALERVSAPESLARMERAAVPLPDPLARAAAASVSSGGRLPLGAGPHPLRVCDLNGGGEAFARRTGWPWEVLDLEGRVVARGGAGEGLDRPALALLRRDRAWGGPLAPPPALAQLARAAGLVIAVGRRSLLDGLDAAAWVHAPGDDPATVAAILATVRGR